MSESASHRAVSARDAGLRRISHVTRWLALGAAGLSGVLALIASHAFHGSSSASSSLAAGQAQQSQLSQPSASDLQPAQSVPTATPYGPVVVSGGS
jgi:hypothetical protein